jgi:mannitol/fructose-specific phosphotransferase system IIA component (Ntr-type)
MRLEKIIARSRVVDLHSVTLEGALEELLAACVDNFPDLKPEALLRGLLARESTMTTYLGHGVALPHVRVKMNRRYVLAIGRSRAGIRHDGAKDDERVRLIFMLIAGQKARDYLQVLASIARQVREQELVDNLVGAPDLDALHERLLGGFGGIRPVQAQQNRINRLMFNEARSWFLATPLWAASRRACCRRGSRPFSSRAIPSSLARTTVSLPRRSRCDPSPPSAWPSCAAPSWSRSPAASSPFPTGSAASAA